MADHVGQRDGWSKFEILAQSIGALGSITISIVLFVVGNRISQQQQDDAARQLEADRVERMLTHLTSPNADEKRLAVKVVEFFVTQNQLPAEIMPAIVEIARSAQTEELADSASQVLETAAGNQGSPGLAKAAQKALSSLPARLDVHPPPGVEDRRNAPAIAALSRENIIVRQQPAAIEPIGKSELRFYRKADEVQALEVAKSLKDKGVQVELRDLSQSGKTTLVRPRKYDLVLAE